MYQVNQNQSIRIAVCIATCKRRQYLSVLLNEIERLIIPEQVTLNIIVVDNDPEKSAQAVVTSKQVNYRFKLCYGFEERRGIPYTRNKTVSLVEKDSDFVIFIDDDEYPKQDWIQKLLEIQAKTDADLVQGPSLPVFTEQPPAWVVKGKFFLFDHHEAATGSPLTYLGVATNNMMIKYQVLRQVKGPFDERLALIGSEDTTLGIHLSQIGCKMVYSRDAVVYEHVSKSRANLRWILQRTYRTSNMYWHLTQHKNLMSAVKLLAGAVVRFSAGFIGLLPALIIAPLMGWHLPVKMLRLMIRGVAITAGMLGKNYEEYKHAYTTSN